MQKIKGNLISISIISFVFFAFSSIFAIEDNLKSQEFENCLVECWGVDLHTSVYIRNKCKPLLENHSYHYVIDDFIEKSKKTKINFSLDKELAILSDNDGIYKAAKQHLVVFETPYVRIFWGSTQPGEREPFHIHVWKSIMLVIKPTTFQIESADNTIETEYYPIGVYELPANEYYACTNIGDTADECLRFEIKE